MSELGREVEACLKPLSDKERAFAQEYALIPNSKAAAVKAGYSATSASAQGSQMLKKPKIRQAINLLRQENELKAGIDQVDILRQLQQIVSRCMQTEPVLGKDGEPTGEYRFDAKNALGAMDIICKMGGHYAAKKVDMDTAITFIQQIGSPDDD